MKIVCLLSSGRRSTLALLIAASTAACGGDVPTPMDATPSPRDDGPGDATFTAHDALPTTDPDAQGTDADAAPLREDTGPGDGGGCDRGAELVDGRCVDCTTIQACGADCAACPAGGSNATYQCAGNTDPAATSCVLGCAAGFRVESGQCVDCSSVMACGRDCAVCPDAPVEGAYGCSGNTMTASASCTLTCSGGFRANNGQCVACDGAGACGSDCAACPADPVGGAYACMGNASPAATSCTLSCQGGAMPVDGQCVACGSPTSCGADCAPCPAAPADGAYSCTSDQIPAVQACELTCDSGYRVDNAQCTSCNLVAACGSDCAACPTDPADGTYACAGSSRPAAQSCDLTCAAGFRPVNGQCVSCRTIQQCGDDCRACPASPANGASSCSGNTEPSVTACTVSCDAGFTLRGNACVACNSLGACGNDCSACPANPPAGTFACANNTQPSAQACALTCRAGFQRNGATCRSCNTTAACGNDCAACPNTGGVVSCNGNTQPAATSCQPGCLPGRRSQNGRCVACGNMSACLSGCGTCTPNPICAGESDPPSRLECTYYYDSAASFTSRTPSSDLYPFDPGFHLWSDGAEKVRYLYLPPNTQIDTSNMDEWTFPIGTRVFKEFRVPDEANPAGPPALVETRMLYKLPNGQWSRTVYVWSANRATRYDGSSGLVTPANVRAPNGNGTFSPDPGAVAAGVVVPGATLDGMTTTYEIPAPDQCRFCHQGRPDDVLGVEAVGLSTPESGACVNSTPGNPCLTMAELVRNSRVTAPPATPIVVPGNATERAALGFLHMNCGASCHNSSLYAFAGFTGFFMRLDTAQLAANNPAVLNTYTTGIRVVAGWQPDGVTGRFRITPGNADDSVMIYRMNARNTRGVGDGEIVQMPPLGSHIPTQDGLLLIRTWMNSLP